MRLLQWYKFLTEPPEKGTYLETLFQFIGRKLHIQELMQARLTVLQTYLTFGVYKLQTGEDQSVTELGEFITTIEEELLSSMNPDIPRVKESHAQEKKEFLKEIRQSGPLRVTSLAPEVSRGQGLQAAFERIRDKVLSDDARNAAHKLRKGR